jgi:mannose-6-phosphate isomerase-like protein (cupin superfamily)
VAGYTLKRIDDMEAAFGGGFKKARAELGVTSFGMQVLDFPANATGYPEHDHAEEGQEEVFAVLGGSGTLRVGDQEVELTPEVLVRVDPAEPRKILSGPDGLRVLALGGYPGEPYRVKPLSELSG